MSFFGKYYFTAAKHLAGEGEEASVQDWMRMRQGAGESPDVWLPPVDMYETDEGVVVLMDVPGCSPENLRLQVSGNTLTVRGVRCEKQARKKRAYRVLEIHHGPFERSLLLPCPVDLATARGCVREGTLEILLPRTQERVAVAVAVAIRIERSDA